MLYIIYRMWQTPFRFPLRRIAYFIRLLRQILRYISLEVVITLYTRHRPSGISATVTAGNDKGQLALGSLMHADRVSVLVKQACRTLEAST